MANEGNNQPYRILHCIDSLGRAGPELQLLQTLTHIDKTRFQHFVCFLQAPNDLENDIVSLGIQVVNLGIKSNRSWLQAMKGLGVLVDRYSIDLIHASTSNSNLYAPLVGAIKHVPVVFTLNTSFDPRDYGRARASFFRQLKVEAFLKLRASILKVTKTRNIAVSCSVKESAVKHLRIPSDRINVVYRGLEPEKYEHRQFSLEAAQRVKLELGLFDAYPILVNVGRLSPEKGQKDLLQAMPIVLEHFPRAKLLVAGNGPIKGVLEELRDKLGLQAHVEFLGQREDIPLLLSVSHIFVAASYFEGLSNAIVEAMAAGKPVVAFDIPMTREVLQDGAGVLVGDRDPVNLATEVVQLVNDRERSQAMGMLGQQIVSDKFDIRRNVRKIEAIYEKTISRLTVIGKRNERSFSV